MSLFTESKVRTRARRETSTKSASTVLAEFARKQAAISKTHIFLSHAFDDRELLVGAVLMIEDLGYSVYIDWRDDPTLDRKLVTPATAAKLKERMDASQCLFYAVTPSATESTWMKWELGYKDGENGRTAILPIVGSSTEAYNTSEQFLGLYPYVSDGTLSGTTNQRLWIHRSRTRYIEFEAWLAGSEPIERS